MKTYNLTPQERDNFCVCSVVQAIFRKYGIEYTQGQISLELTSSGKGFHIDDLRFGEFMMRNGFRYTFFGYNATNFNEPDMLLREMNSNHGIIGIGHHALLLINFIDPKLKVMDPEHSEILDKNLYGMLKKMEELERMREKRSNFEPAENGFGLIKHIQ